MRKLMITCDRCGKDTGSQGYKVVFGYENETMAGRIDSPETDKLDFCEDCMKQIQEMVIKFASGSEPEEPKKAKKAKKPASGPKLDKGKIRALSRAGWRPKDIAGDVGCSLASVYAVIKEMGNGAAESVLETGAAEA